ncbi:MAG: ral nucleoside transport system ATP-binding protein [Bacillota bacterium]|nr:ral nucleoside transport system ATP-binding protein [Bacillota bacterium]
MLSGDAACVVEMRDITKRFPGVLANDRITFRVRGGEVHALLGENGAGKSTLMNILAGLYRPDAGEILVKGRRVHLGSPRHAIAAGIGMVHQHFRLVQTFTVAQNITLGMPQPRFVLNMRAIEEEIARLSSTYGLQVDPRAKIWQLSVGEQQRVEIVKMLYRGADVLILDEPTAVLTPQEARDLFATLNRMKQAGRSIIFITHKLDEVMEVADRVTVLRDGRAIATLDRKDATPKLLANLMVGREIGGTMPGKREACGECVLRISGVSALGDRGTLALRGVSLEVAAGEILGIAGVAGNGQRELAEVITGLRRVQEGCIMLRGADITSRTPLEVIRCGVGHIPEDRLGTGMVPNLSVVDNVILKSYRSRPVAKGPFIHAKAAREHAADLVQRFQVKAAGLDRPIRLLSGGNSQKLLLAREISANPSLLVAVHPTRGLDIGATEAIHRMLIEQRNRGVAILLISEDLEELAALADRVAVLFAGRVMGVLRRDEWDIERIGLMMAGSATADTTGCSADKGDRVS